MKKVIFCVLFVFATKSVFCLNFVEYGDTRTNPDRHLAVVTQFSKDNPELVIHTGDLWDGYTQSQFLNIITSQANIKALLYANKFLVARGNHESESAVLAFTPSIVLNKSILYSFKEGECFFVCMGYDPGLNNTYLLTQLSSLEAQTSTWKIVYAHKPVYSTGSHGADGITSEGTSVVNFRALCDSFGVNLYFSGHDHIYERTKLIYKGMVVDTSNNIPNSKKGTIYIVDGCGGAPTYPMSQTPPFWRKIGLSGVDNYGFIQSNKDSLVCTIKSNNGTVLDRFVFYNSTTKNIISTAQNKDLKILEIKIKDIKLSFVLFPSKFSTIKIYSVSGKLLTKNSFSLIEKNINMIDLSNISSLTRGVYLVELLNDKKIYTKTIVLK